MDRARDIRRIRRDSAICASTTPGSSSVPPECGKSANARVATHAEDGVAAHQLVEIHGVEVAIVRVGKAAHVARRDRPPHPLDEQPSILARPHATQSPEARARQWPELRVTHTEESGP